MHHEVDQRDSLVARSNHNNMAGSPLPILKDMLDGCFQSIFPPTKA
jgi:hypothetical protein